MEYKNINEDFVSRTISIINTYEGEYDVTLLINCCVGLLVLPKELFNESMPDSEIPITGSYWGLKRSYFTFGPQGSNFSLNEVIRRVRNGICHFKVQTIPDGSGDISTIVIKDTNKSGSNTFHAELPISALKELVLNLAKFVRK